mmetsp:Transcript_18541/g.24588  ORF Transcript_18541/g.24588 Transcript_18541/m.24588 type:complete len:385 (-) Transcript_18541:125-1279(-)
MRKFTSKTARSITGSIDRATELKRGGKHDQTRSVLSSSPRPDKRRDHSLPTFENGIVIRDSGNLVEMEQAIDSLQLALNLIKEAKNEKGTWVDARDLLDETAAALDEAGLALRRSPGSSSANSANSVKQTEAKIIKLADKVVKKRQRLLGGCSVHDADGVWTKSVYGDGDGISFDADNDELRRVPDEEKEEKALIVYASQTGTSKMFAKSLSKSLGGETCCVVRNMKSIGIKDLAMHKRVYIISSTFGYGRPPRDGELLYSQVQLETMRCKENLEDLSIDDEEVKKPLAGTSVAIAALGSSAFRDFAKFGLNLTDELVSLGASTALKTTTVDAKNGKSEQKQMFQKWESAIVQMEKERQMKKERTMLPTTRRQPSKMIPSSKAA